MSSTNKIFWSEKKIEIFPDKELHQMELPKEIVADILFESSAVNALRVAKWVADEISVRLPVRENESFYTRTIRGLALDSKQRNTYFASVILNKVINTPKYYIWYTMFKDLSVVVATANILLLDPTEIKKIGTNHVI